MIGRSGWGAKFQASTDGVSYTTVGQLCKTSFDGQETQLIDQTQITSGSFKQKLAVLIDAGTFSYSGVLNPADSGYGLLKTLQEGLTLAYFKLILPPGTGSSTNLTWRGYVKTHKPVDLDVKKLAAFSGVIEINGQVTLTLGDAWTSH